MSTDDLIAKILSFGGHLQMTTFGLIKKKWNISYGEIRWKFGKENLEIWLEHKDLKEGLRLLIKKIELFKEKHNK